MSEREWYPADWVDEACPPSKPRPEDFVVVNADGAWQLGYEPGDQAVLDDDREIFNQALEIGDVVNFMCCDRFDDVDMTIWRDGRFKPAAPIPPEHNWVTIDGDMDTLRDSFDEILKVLRDPSDDAYAFQDADGVSVTLCFARWSDLLPHQFSIENGKPMFRQISAAKASN